MILRQRFFAWWGIFIAATLFVAPQWVQAQMVGIPAIPTVQWLQEGPWADNGISPKAGDTNTVFSFRVLYKSAHDRRPRFVEVCFEGPKTFCRRQMGYIDTPNYRQPFETLEQIEVQFDTPGEYTFHYKASDFVWPFAFRYPEEGGFSLSVGVGERTSPAVLFIPGLQGSRLYSDESGSEKKLWEPTVNGDVTKLFLNDQGESVSSDIYTRDIIDEAFGHNIYKTFGQFMDGLVDEGTLVAWRAAPYDWRFDVDDHVPTMIQELESLVAESPTSPVTIIAHSNGGLIAKDLVTELERQKSAGESDLLDSVDRLVLVAVPQLGTPKTIPSLLHGFDLDYAKGALLNSAIARALAQHMPSASPLLPAEGYFDAVLDPVITFDPSVDRFVPWRALYGDSINSQSELRSFLTGGSGAWGQPNANDVVSPAVLKDHFLAAAAEDHAEWADWQAPSGIDVIQVAGWGLDTVKTVKYKAKKVFSCGDLSPTFCKDGYKLDYEPVFTADGDQTVVVPSAIISEENQFYVNLEDFNSELLAGLRRNRDHADFFEARPVHELIEALIEGANSLPEHVTDFRPDVDEEDERIRVSVHSPVSLLVCSETPGDDGQPLCAGVESVPGSDIRRKVEDLPNSYYMEFGEGKYVGFSAGESHTISLEGQGVGTFTMKVDEVDGNTVVDTLVYEDIPVVSGMEVNLGLQSVDTVGALQIDLQGDGTADISLQPGAELSSQQLVDLFEQTVASLNLSKGARSSTEAHIKNVRKFLEKKQKNSQSIESQLKNIVKKINGEIGRSITVDEAATVAQIVDMIRMRL